jgi:hypothetical protein
MGRNKHEYSSEEIAQLKIELYCQSCCTNFFKEKTKKCQLVYLFNRHLNSKKHKLNSERFRMELENQFKYEKLCINDTEIEVIEPLEVDNLNDEHMTSISSIISKNSLLKIENKIQNLDDTNKELSDTNSVLFLNYNEMDSRTQVLSNLINQLKKEQHKNNDDLTNKINILSEEIKKNKRYVSFNESNVDNKSTIFKLLVKQGEIINDNYELTRTVLDSLKTIMKKLIKLTNKVSKQNIKIHQLLTNQYDILTSKVTNTSRDILIEIHEQLLDLYSDQL